MHKYGTKGFFAIFNAFHIPGMTLDVHPKSDLSKVKALSRHFKLSGPSHSLKARKILISHLRCHTSPARQAILSFREAFGYFRQETKKRRCGKQQDLMSLS